MMQPRHASNHSLSIRPASVIYKLGTEYNNYTMYRTLFVLLLQSPAPHQMPTPHKHDTGYCGHVMQLPEMVVQQLVSSHTHCEHSSSEAN